MRSIQLMPGERIIRDSGVTAWYYIFNLLGGLVVVPMLALAFGLLRSWVLLLSRVSEGATFFNLILDNQGLIVGLTLAALYVGIFSSAWSRRYVLTDSRLVVASGILQRVELAADLTRIQDVSMHQTLVGRILSYGNLAIETAGTHGLLVVRYVDAPHEWFVAVTKSAEESETRVAANLPRAATLLG